MSSSDKGERERSTYDVEILQLLCNFKKGVANSTCLFYVVGYRHVDDTNLTFLRKQ